MSVVDLATGEPISSDGQDPAVLIALRRVLAAAEDGSLALEGFYLIADAGKETRSYDSGLTLESAICMLEREKFRILCMSEGVKL